MKTTLVFFIVIALYLDNSYQQCLTVNDNISSTDKKAREGLYSGQQEFSLRLLQSINQFSPNENLFFSPYSTYHALLIAYFISRNQTENYLKKALRLNPDSEKFNIYQAYKIDKLTTQYQTINSTFEFTNANKIYVADYINIRECIKPLFEQELELAPFRTDPEGSRIRINKWVETQTHNMIKDLLDGGAIDVETNLVLVNAAYFKGIWENKFDIKQTKPEIFYVSPSKQIMVDMMHIEGTFNYDAPEDLSAHILEMPYKGDQISMYILLPPFAKEGAVDDTLKKLTLEKFKNIVERNGTLESRTVQVSFPKFSLEQTIELVPVLTAYGIGDLFSETRNLSGLTDEKLNLGKAIHKAKIEVNEEGTKAAATTVLFSFRSSRPAEPAQFICNHPFIYIIYNKQEQAVLFTGVFRKPN